MKVVINNNGWISLASENDKEADNLRTYFHHQSTRLTINTLYEYSEHHAFNHNSFAVRFKLFGPQKVMHDD